MKHESAILLVTALILTLGVGTSRFPLEVGGRR